jgi:16S rRNA (guanine966-N2)-methyltransferase
VRAALFSSLGDLVEGARFLDVFAGTGAVGIEAYSRGAAHITFIDKQTKVIASNVKLIADTHAYKIITSDVLQARLSGTYDVIYIDPPYGEYEPAQLLTKLAGVLADTGTMVLEESKRAMADLPEIAPDGQAWTLSCTKTRKYGDTVLTYWEKRL